ncbi:hypothetical protein LUZ60_012384 [Juncus effusus]|nr:hypothetical protein LUZ60_012384 [Juncus effusus]
MQTFSHKTLSLLFFFLSLTLTSAQNQYQTLPASQTKLLVRLNHLLKSPAALSALNNSTNFCYLPQSPNLTISCENNRITQLIVIGDRPITPNWHNSLSSTFSIDAFFTTLVKLSSLKVLTLTSLGLWGSLPSKIDRLDSLQVLNLSSNYIYGEIPQQISTMASLQSLVLSRNYFNGTIPDLKPLMGLTELDLGFNGLGPDFPNSLSKSIVKLVLKSNTFKAKIPENLASSLSLIQQLDLSFNQLNGWIPSSLLSLNSIQYLDLSNNKLTGQLPTFLKCGSSINYLDISNNMLIGTLPSCIISNSSSRVVDFSWNCLNSVDLEYQHANSFCNQGALAAILPPQTDINQSKQSNKSLIIGIVGGILGGVVIIGLIIGVILKKAKKNGQLENGSVFKPKERNNLVKIPSRTPVETRHESQAAKIGTMEVTNYRVFSIEEIEEATNNFDPSNLIKDSTHGQQYRAQLQDGTAVVVKCLKLKQKYNSPQNLVQYMEIISKLRHRHVVSIIGHCVSNGQDLATSPAMMYLVLEFVSNGTLRSHLTEWRKREMLKWPQRVSASIGITRGIQFLHNFSGIVGNEINTENILLDQTLTAKICNYNLPKIPNNKNKGGCESPFIFAEDCELVSTSNLEQGQKEDVFQLGLILLELITGKPTESNQLDSVKFQIQKGLTEGKEKLKAIADPSIVGTFAIESLRIFTEITLNCLSLNAKDRPSIDDILWNLQYSVQVQEGWASSESLSVQF